MRKNKPVYKVYELVRKLPNGMAIRRCDGNKDSEKYCLFYDDIGLGNDNRTKEYDTYVSNIIYIFITLIEKNNKELNLSVKGIFRYIHEKDGILVYSFVFEEIEKRCSALPILTDEEKEKFTIILDLLYCYMCSEWKYVRTDKKNKKEILGSNITMYFYERNFQNLKYGMYNNVPKEIVKQTITEIYNSTFNNHNIKKDCKKFGFPYLGIYSYSEEKPIMRDDGTTVFCQTSLF